MFSSNTTIERGGLMASSWAMQPCRAVPSSILRTMPWLASPDVPANLTYKRCMLSFCCRKSFCINTRECLYIVVLHI
ncbi:Uncharacterized protein HZ326_11857 [Fusarium oxysporum f. sp. albedinis]|nr:Uncharacterized protein HZ326_11857 [Fusarium oxysporum f. sp. albedinis]